MKTITASRRALAVIGLVALVVIGAIGWWLSRSDDTPVAGMPARIVQAGAVEVTMTPLALDDSGAVFQVVLDTHSMELDQDMAAAAHLRINDTTVDGARWDGPGPGGHHREGTLRFTTPVPPGALVELRITGLPPDAIGSWNAPDKG